MLDRQGMVMNDKKLRRFYREEKLQARRHGGVGDETFFLDEAPDGSRYFSRTSSPQATARSVGVTWV
jgi:hypothetical protein